MNLITDGLKGQLGVKGLFEDPVDLIGRLGKPTFEIEFPATEVDCFLGLFEKRLLPLELLFALPSLLLWPTFVVAYATAVAGFDSVAVPAFMAVMALSALTILTVLATWRGSRAHHHLSPGVPYHVLAVLFGPVVGVHYLWRTGAASSNARSGA